MNTEHDKRINPATDGAEMNFRKKMSYVDYLSLDSILTAQHPKTDKHDELLFIIQHQTSELWMALIIHELDAARRHIADDKFQTAFKMLSRVAKIFEQLNNAWDVLRSMTPSEYTAFREGLGQSSGFQSTQYRLIEFMVGNRNHAMLKPHAHRPEFMERFEAELAKPSLYQEVARALARSGFELDSTVLDRDPAEPHQFNQSLTDAWQRIYEAPEDNWIFYELAEKLVDFEDYFRRWRFNHVTTVERVIGFKRGTGGTSGISYLKKMLEVELFPELWRVRTVL